MLAKLYNDSWLQQYGSIATPLFILVLALLFAPLYGAVVSPDSTHYMSVAANLHRGLGYVDSAWLPISIRGPVFPALISLSFRFFGESVESALYVVRLFFVGNILVVYWFGRQLGGRQVGLFAALLVLTSTTIHYWSARVHLDNVMPFFMLLSNAILFYAVRTEKLFYFALSGFILGIGFLVKDVAGLFAITPILIWGAYKPFRTRKNILAVLIYGISFSVLAIAWLFYAIQANDSNYFLNWLNWIFTLAFQSTDSSASITNISTPPVPTQSIVTTIIDIFASIVDGLFNYYKIYFAESFAVAPAFVLSWLFILYRALRRRFLEDIFLLSLFFIFLPIMLFLGNSGFRAGQTVYTYLLSYLVLAYASIKVLPSINIRWALFVLVLLIQLLARPSSFLVLLRDHGSDGFVSAYKTYSFNFWLEDSSYTNGWDSSSIRDAGEWLAQNNEDSRAIIADWQWRDAYYFYMNSKQPIYDIEYITSGTVKLADVQNHPAIRFIWTQNGTDPSKSLSTLLGFSESHFLSQVKQHNAAYIIFGKQRNFLSIYLRSHPDFIPVAEFNNSEIQIFEVKSNAPLQMLERSQLFVSSNIRPYLNNFRSQRGYEEYQKFVESYFVKDLQLDNKTVRDLENGLLPTYTNNTISHHQYAVFIKQVDRKWLRTLINMYKRRIDIEPQNLWNMLTLANLYQADEQKKLARTTFEQAISTIDLTSVAYLAVRDSYQHLYKDIDSESIIQDKMVALFKTHFEQNLDDIEAYWQLAEMYMQFDETESVLAIYQAAQARWPESAYTTWKLAQFYHDNAQFEEAVTTYQNLLKMQPDTNQLPTLADIHVEIGKLLLAKNQGRLNRD